MTQEEIQKLLDEFGQSKIALTPQWKIDHNEHLKSIASSGNKAVREKYNNKVGGYKGKPILQYDSDGNFVKEHLSLRDAGIDLGTTDKVIYEITKRRRLSSYKGYMFRYKKDDTIPTKIESLHSILNPTCEHCGKQVAKGMYSRWHGDNCKHK